MVDLIRQGVNHHHHRLPDHRHRLRHLDHLVKVAIAVGVKRLLLLSL